METIDRKPAVAGQFYPANPDRLHQELKNLFSNALPRKHRQVRAIISPHAGYVFSGKVAASVFSQIDGNASYKRIFLIASSHQEHFEGAAIYCDGDFIMPYGKERVDTKFGRELVELFPDIFTADRHAHQKEHSLEVQLPFLHEVLKTDYRIVPIILGTSSPLVCKKIAKALKTWFNPDNLFIISSDFSHYPNDTDARNIDNLTKEAILSNQPEKLLGTLAENTKKHVPHLLTSLCGWTSVLTLLYMTTGNESIVYSAIDYSNSSDSPLYGDSGRVVGYWGLAISEEPPPGIFEEDGYTEKESAKNAPAKNKFELSESDKNILLELARKTLEEKVRNGKMLIPDSTGFTQNLKTCCGAFVSLHINGKLRGCIGRLVGNIPLYKMIQEMAVSSALHDPRFRPVSPDELSAIDLELSVLSPLQKISGIGDIQLGKHGIYLMKGQSSGVFLPQVAMETGWSLEEFLGHCARDKAGLDWDGWKTAEIFIFTATVFWEK